MSTNVKQASPPLWLRISGQSRESEFQNRDDFVFGVPGNAPRTRQLRSAAVGGVPALGAEVVGDAYASVFLGVREQSRKTFSDIG